MSDRVAEEKGSSPGQISLSTDDPRMTVEFFWVEDRFTHRVLIDGRNGENASCLDGDAFTEWPASPPLQQLSHEIIDGKPVILGVGSAGRSHWSVSVVPVETENGDGLRFEWACRHRSQPTFLGTTYQNTSSIQFFVDDETTEQRQENNATIFEPKEKSSSDQGTRCWSYTLTVSRASA